MGTDTTTKSRTQTAQILAHLTAYGSITPMEALRKYGCMRLGARIWDLRKRGTAIDTERVDFISKSGHHGKYAKYVIRNSN